jgi:hypothetical protein
MLHKDIGLGYNHKIHQWEPANEAARLALSVTVDDIGKIARQLDTGDFYLLVDNSPLDWRVFASSDAVAGVLEVTARNNTGVSISKASAVYITGASGQTPTIALANAVSEATSSKTIGITAESIANAANGQIVLRGLLTNIDTSAFVDGDALWLSDSVAGAFTTTRPTQPSHGVFIGYVAYAHATLGKIIVNIQNGYELDELHNVLITSPLDGGILVYDTATQLWVDSTLLAELDPQIADIAPLSYTGNALKVMRVKATEDGWELVTPSAGSALQVLDEGTPLTAGATSLNFVGAGVTAAVAGTDVTITIAGGGGGLTNFTEAINTAAPNATIPVASLTATNAATNVDAVIKPKGTGALLATIPDGTSVGGDKRGPNAVDLQTSRSASNKVAVGANSTISGGGSNAASTNYSTVSGGTNNTAAGGEYSTVGGGGSNTASGLNATVAGGASNTASGTNTTVGGGSSNTVNGRDSVIPGGTNGSVKTRKGAIVYSSNRFTANGDSQWCMQGIRTETYDAVAKNLTQDSGGTFDATNNIVLDNNSVVSFTGFVQARQNTTGDSSVWKVEGAIKRVANAASTILLGTPTVTLVGQDAGAAAWVLALTADTTAGGLKLTVTGEAAKTIRWNSYLQVVELTG